jgi:hypothetical protein
VGVIFNRQAAFLWLLTMLLFSPSCFQTDFIHGLFTESEKKLDLYFNFIEKKDDILSLNNYTFGDFNSTNPGN